MTQPHGPTPRPPLSWPLIVAGWFVASAAMGALNGKQLEDLTWLPSGAAQVAGMLAIGVTAFALFGLLIGQLLKRLNDLAGPTLLIAVGRCLGLGLVYAIGRTAGVWLGGEGAGLSALGWVVNFGLAAMLMGAAIFVFAQLFRSPRGVRS